MLRLNRNESETEVETFLTPRSSTKREEKGGLSKPSGPNHHDTCDCSHHNKPWFHWTSERKHPESQK